jgi:hypothetical protein
MANNCTKRSSAFWSLLEKFRGKSLNYHFQVPDNQRLDYWKSSGVCKGTRKPVFLSKTSAGSQAGVLVFCGKMESVYIIRFLKPQIMTR